MGHTQMAICGELIHVDLQREAIHKQVHRDQ